ncbi:MAG: hypothetical protein IKI50_01070 [Clostridia bacterium]|nr:hypothetical protein [Clostridia bacterium]
MKTPAPALFTPRVTRGEDGVYRWVYEVNLFTHPTYFFLVWKIFFCLFLGISAVVLLADLANWGARQALSNLPFLGYFLLGMTVVTALGYLLYAAVMGGKYVVEFEMDDKGVLHRQTAAQAKKAKRLSALTALGGLVSGRMTTVGVGMNARRTEMYTEFARVRKVKAYPRRRLIKVNGRLSRNQVYAPAEDFELVRQFIVSRCEKVRNISQ